MLNVRPIIGAQAGPPNGWCGRPAPSVSLPPCGSIRPANHLRSPIISSGNSAPRSTSRDIVPGVWHGVEMTVNDPSPSRSRLCVNSPSESRENPRPSRLQEGAGDALMPGSGRPSNLDMRGKLGVAGRLCRRGSNAQVGRLLCWPPGFVLSLSPGGRFFLDFSSQRSLL
jgi:hypothetical protein